MLKEITIKNFRSFKDEVTFSMEADYNRVSEFKNHIIEKCNNRLLKVASFYGPNGGGKSNLLKAIALASDLLKVSNNRATFIPNDMKCVFCDDDKIEETLFFVTDKYEIGFNFVIESKITEKELIINNFKSNSFINDVNIVKERVVYRTKNDFDFILLYERDVTGAVESDAFDKLNIKMLNLSKSKLVLSKIYEEYANNDYVESVYLDVIKSLYLEINSIVFLDTINNNPQNIEVISNAIKTNKEKLVKLLNDVDIHISDIKIYRNKPNFVYFVRSVEYNGENKIREIPISEESKGTIKIFNIFLLLLIYSKLGMIYLCDDMNSYLHPKLYRTIIEFFNSEENKNQLIFNSHDITNMNNELFRRDEIWFAYRDSNYSSKLIPLSNIVNYKGEQIRNDAKYNKQYLEGRFGADPFIKKGLNWNE